MLFDVDDAAVFERHARGETGFAQRQRDIVPCAKMFFDQRRQLEVGKDIAAVNNERLRREKAFDILDPAAGPEQVRLVNES